MLDVGLVDVPLYLLHFAFIQHSDHHGCATLTGQHDNCGVHAHVQVGVAALHCRHRVYLNLVGESQSFLSTHHRKCSPIVLYKSSAIIVHHDYTMNPILFTSVYPKRQITHLGHEITTSFLPLKIHHRC